jgi:NAD+ kinase
MRAAGFVVHPGRPAAIEAARRLGAWLEERGVATRTSHGDIGDGREAEAFARELDLVVAIGGDGTFLRAAHVASHADAPVLGVKVGRMGFLTEVEPERATEVLEGWLQGAALIEDRLAVLATSGDGAFAPQWALNEIIVEKSARHRLIRLALLIDDTYVTTFSADGVIVATPTGSTAYSFSAGGPIVSPSVPGIVVTPVAAHMVFDRSFVLAKGERVALRVLGEEPALLSADGRASLELGVGAIVTIAEAPRPARLVRRRDAPSFHERLRTKFQLPDAESEGDDAARAP